MNDQSINLECQCQCGNVKFTIRAEPIVRVFCHCTICQEFNNAAYSDVAIFLSKDVCVYDKQKVVFKKYKSPPAVQRGKCEVCNKPAIEIMDLPLFPSLTIIPSENVPSGDFLPESFAHIFYHRRLQDISDALPKHSSFIKSQFSLITKLLPGIYRRFINAK